MASMIISSLLEKCLAKIYANFCTGSSTLNVTRQSIQQQKGVEHLLLPLGTIGHKETIYRI